MMQLKCLQNTSKLIMTPDFTVLDERMVVARALVEVVVVSEVAQGMVAVEGMEQVVTVVFTTIMH
jgi:hypothetical protein